MGLSINYYLTGRFDESYAIYHTQLALDPDDFFMGYLAAQVLFAAGATDDGERQMRHAIAAIQRDKQKEAEAEIALFRGDYARCRELTVGLDPFLKSGGSFSVSSVARACAVRQRDYVGALALLQPDLERSAGGKGDLLGNANPVLEQAILLGLLEQHSEARPLLELARHTAQVAIDSGNENWKNWLRVAAVERSSGKDEDAYRALDEAFAHGMTINARTDGDLEFLPFRDDARFAQLRDGSRAKVAAMRDRIAKMLQDADRLPASADVVPQRL
jgi:tetratricopeptide (TPR) repeat protein